MPKKKKSAFGEGLSAVADILFSTAFSKVEEEADILLDKAQSKADVLLHRAEVRAKRLVDQMLKELTSGLVVMLGAFFLLVALYFHLIQMGQTPSGAALYIGGGLLILGLFLKYKYLKEQRGN